MKSFTMAAVAVAATAGAAGAGGIDRARLSYGVLFEQGRYMELGVSTASPSVQGAYVAPLTAFGPTTGNMAQSYTTLSFAYKADLSDRFSYALYVNTPYGADALYTLGGYTGLEAHWSSTQVAAIARYKVNEGVSIYGGVRAVTSSAEIRIPDLLIRGALGQGASALAAQARAAAAAGQAATAARLGAAATAYGTMATTSPAGSLDYTAEGASDTRYAPVIGVAYERPDIALRVGLTYEPGFTHEFATVETGRALGVTGGPTTVTGITAVEVPDTITLDFQTGVAKDTLLFGSVRYAKWSVWEVRPAGYDGVFQTDITSFDNDVMTYQLGIGRRINDNLSVFARATYEEPKGGEASRLAPTDGVTSFGVGGTWRKDNIRITGGIEYATVGDAVDGSGTTFSGNDVLGVGLTVGFTF
jgi:long-subunit fatty acid transport protein